MANDPREQILSVLKNKGPLVPNDLKKIINGDTMIFGAILSELSSRGLVKISDLKKGSSPFYYLPSDEAKLESVIEFLNPKDQVTVRTLKEQQVMLDKNLELFQRVSLRNIKDFAKQITVNTSDGPLLFWRYFLIDETTAINILKQRHNKPQEEPAPIPVKEPEQKVEEKIEETVEEVKPVHEKQQVNEPQENKVQELPSHPNIRKPIVEEKPAVKKETLLPVSSNKLQENAQQQLKTSQGLLKSPFYDSVWKFFSEQEINVLEETLISKDREYEFVVSVPSAIGTIKYYCRARNKKKLNEGDVAPALLKAKQKDLQCLFLTNGDFSKKSLDLIKKEYSGIIIKKFS